MRLMVLMNAPHWGGERCQDSSCSLLSLPRRPKSVLALLGDAGRSVCFLGRNATCHTHTHTHTIVHNVLFPRAGNECNAVSLLRHPSLPSRECSARVPAPSSRCQWPGWGWAPSAAARHCSGLLGESVSEGAAEAKLTGK